MGSRMDKYKQIEDNTLNRKTRHLSSYKEAYGSNYEDFDTLPVPSNFNEIDMEGLKSMIKTRNGYQKIEDARKKLDIDNQKKAKEKEAQDKIYDINELIKKAREKEEKTVEIKEEKKFQTKENFLTSIESAIITREKKDIASPPVEEVGEVTLSLDILEDLKPGENTEVIEPIEEINNTKKDLVNSFYSTKYKFNNKDFDDENDDFLVERKSHTIIKIILVIVLLIIVTIGALYLLDYLGIEIPLSFWKKS